MEVPSAVRLKEWFDHGLAISATHLIVLTDHTPVYVMDHENPRHKVKTLETDEDGNPTEKVWQILKMSKPKDSQCNFHALYRQRARNF